MLNCFTVLTLIRGRAVRQCVVCVALAGLVFCAGCQNGPTPAGEFVTQAEQLHRASLASAVNGDKDLNEYFDEMGRRVVAGATAADSGKTRDPVLGHMRFHLVGSETINAFDTGGGHIYIYNGLFQLCQSEDELAAVLAHEFAHAVSLDIEKTGMKPLPAGPLDRMAYQFVLYPFTGATELAADELAFTFYVRGGWDPARFGDIFDRLRQKPGFTLGGPPPSDRPGGGGARARFPPAAGVAELASADRRRCSDFQGSSCPRQRQQRAGRPDQPRLALPSRLPQLHAPRRHARPARRPGPAQEGHHPGSEFHSRAKLTASSRHPESL